MSTSIPQNEWLVIVPDYPGTLEKRMAVRQQHIDELNAKIEAGEMVFGGATLSESPVKGRPLKLKGSAMLLKLETEADVRKWLERDVYAKGGAWDLTNVQVYPFKCAVRKPL
jgi:uncharacterized protein